MLLHENKQLKAAALARLKAGVPAEEVAEDMALPLTLINEWNDTITTRDISLAMARTVNTNELVETVTNRAEQLNMSLEEVQVNIVTAANKIATEVVTVPLISFDLERARTLQLLSNSLSGLYNALFNKPTSINILNANPGQSGAPMSQFYRKD